MLLIPCPFCGPRAQIEFAYGGQSDIVRPKTPDAASDQEWAEYLFFRDNPKGSHRERWCHRDGCGLWFNLLRDTVTHRIARSSPVDESRGGNA
ncbi:MAG: sarcosine oxidase subunit delta [Betaproteobacteria bacterium]|nr:sarcosine oxidase subunit delta [Betaproteobacteria bacterium]